MTYRSCGDQIIHNIDIQIIKTQNNVKLQTIENKIFTIQERQVILDSDVPELYSVETKRINEAVKK